MFSKLYVLQNQVLAGVLLPSYATCIYLFFPLAESLEDCLVFKKQFHARFSFSPLEFDSGAVTLASVLNSLSSEELSSIWVLKTNKCFCNL